MKIDSADMRIALWAYVGMLGVTSLMQALEIRAQNFNNLPASHVMAYVLICYLSPVERHLKHCLGPSLIGEGNLEDDEGNLFGG